MVALIFGIGVVFVWIMSVVLFTPGVVVFE